MEREVKRKTTTTLWFFFLLCWDPGSVTSSRFSLHSRSSYDIASRRDLLIAYSSQARSPRLVFDYKNRRLLDPYSSLSYDAQASYCPSTKYKKQHLVMLFFVFCAGTQARTGDPLLFRQMLYQLSYPSIFYFYYRHTIYTFEQSTNRVKSLLTFDIFAAKPSRAIPAFSHTTTDYISTHLNGLPTASCDRCLRKSSRPSRLSYSSVNKQKTLTY